MNYQPKLRCNVAKTYFLIRYSIILLFYCSIFSASAQTDSTSLMARGLKSYNNQQYADAKLIFSGVLIFDKGNTEAIYYKAESEYCLNDFKTSAGDFANLIKLKGDDARYLMGYGCSLNSIGKYKKAIPYFDKALEINSKMALAYNNRGFSYESLGKYQQALINFNEAIHADSTFAGAYLNRGSAIYSNQNIASASKQDILMAISDFSKAIQFDSGFCICWRNRAVLYERLKQYDKAMADYNKAAECNPDTVTLLYRASAKNITGDYKGAEEDCMHVRSMNRKIPRTYLELSIAQAALGYYDEALKDCDDWVKVNKKDKVLAEFQMARVYALSGDKTNMMANLNKVKHTRYFKYKSNKADFYADKSFEKYKMDKDFRAFVNKL